jgi:hypothetical protein
MAKRKFRAYFGIRAFAAPPHILCWGFGEKILGIKTFNQ